MGYGDMPDVMTSCAVIMLAGAAAPTPVLETLPLPPGPLHLPLPLPLLPPSAGT